MLLIVGLIETAQYVFVDILPRSYDRLSDLVEATFVFGLVILLVRWRDYALDREELVEQLRQAEHWREDMTAMLIHDLKNPVISSALALQAVLRRQSRTNNLSDREMAYLHMARESQVRLGDMIGDLLAISQAESGSMALQLEELDVCGVVAAVVAEMAPQATAGQLDLQRECPGPVYLRGDEFRLRRALENLLANALKFTPPGGSICVVVTADDRQVELRVSDTGHGIPPEAQDRVFHKFGQAAAGIRMSVGLGLTFCKLVAEAHGGSIRLESRPGQGSTFTVLLPRGRDDGDGGAGTVPPEAKSPTR